MNKAQRLIKQCEAAKPKGLTVLRFNTTENKAVVLPEYPDTAAGYDAFEKKLMMALNSQVASDYADDFGGDGAFLNPDERKGYVFEVMTFDAYVKYIEKHSLAST